MDKKNNAAERFKEVRRLLGFTQQQLATELMLTRNYVAKIETGVQEPSMRTIMALESLRVRLSNNLPDAKTPAVGEEEADIPVAAVGKLAAKLRADFEFTLSAAIGDPQRLHWLAEQMREHLTPPRNWRMAKRQLVPVTLPSQNQLLSSETGKPIPEPSPRAHSA